MFSEGLALYRDLLEPGRSVVALVSAEERPEGINVRIQSLEALDAVMAGLKQIRVFVKDAAKWRCRAWPRLVQHRKSSHRGEACLRPRRLAILVIAPTQEA